LAYSLQKELQKKMANYLILITAGVAFLILINLFKGEHLAQFVFLLFFTFFYIIWGIFNYYQETKKIHYKIVIEYIIFGFITLFLLKIIILP